jgi:hypothetical protein
MTVYRLCTHNAQLCSCNDVEMQPCLAAMIEHYLAELVDMDAPDLSGFRLYPLGYDISNLLVTHTSWDALRTAIEGE